MIDGYLQQKLKENAPELLAILKQYGVNVDKYEKEAQTISEQAKAREMARKARPAISDEQKEINRQARERRKEEKRQAEERARVFQNEAQAEYSLYQINAFKDVVSLAGDYLKEQSERRENAIAALKNVAFNIAPAEMEEEKRFIGRKENETLYPELKIKRVKAEFIKYYLDKWFLLLIDLISRDMKYNRG